MPVTASARKALRTATRRHGENLAKKHAFKKAVKVVKKAISVGTEEVMDLMSQAQSALDKAAKSNTIHPNKASRLKSRLAKKLSIGADAVKEKVATKAKPSSKAKTATKAKAASKAKAKAKK